MRLGFAGRNVSTEPAEISVDCPGCGKRFTVGRPACGQARQMQGVRHGGNHPAAPRLRWRMISTISRRTANRPPLRGTSPRRLSPLRRADSCLLRTGPRKKRSVRRIHPADPFEGNKFKNLFFPLILIAGTATFNVLSDTLLTHNAAGRHRQRIHPDVCQAPGGNPGHVDRVSSGGQTPRRRVWSPRPGHHQALRDRPRPRRRGRPDRPGRVHHQPRQRQPGEPRRQCHHRQNHRVGYSA